MNVGSLFLNCLSKIVMRRHVSTKFLRPHPRPYRRRLYDKALEPILPSQLENKRQILEEGDIFDFQLPPIDPQDYSEYEMAEVAMIRSWINEKQFRLMGFCQVSHVNESTQWLTQNQFRLKGLEYKKFTPKIMHKLFESTPFQTLNVMFDDHTAYLFGKDEESLRVLVNESAKHNWLTLLAATLDKRVIGIDTLEKMATLPSVDSLRAETAQILERIPHELMQTLDHSSHELYQNLTHIATQH